jgi:hypothetical protein
LNIRIYEAAAERAGDGAGIAEAPYRRRPPWRGGGAAIESRYKAKPDAAGDGTRQRGGAPASLA